ncbi:phospholipase D family protein [Pseudorhodoferax sp. Leaf267]|uniref:phospholipase D family protein n=1 Tax=Pseudorhodoferax sp. Leaf267 TaxID=1736316 RepID=UPI0006F2BBCB|nr:phospholipase D family protein [Pseudorhodoferax sp. Leaf267]KQP22861.1 phospholipase [Pseudorhodoferax sp. Leaf267]
MTATAARLLLACLLALLTGCASLPDGLAGPPSTALPPMADASLVRIARLSQPDADLSGFRLLPSGDFALDARLTLIQRAEVSLDVQYYHVENDATGRHFLRALRDAAQRGVRVRLLLDDLYTAGDDGLFLSLAATPNLELRIYNPFPQREGGSARRFAASLLQFDRLQRRMHNKLLLADGAMGVAGGRNIGARYYTQTSGENFLDMDTIVAGALMPRLAALFDLYWNSPHVVPIERLAKADPDLAAMRERFEALTAPGQAPPPRPSAPNDMLGYAPVSSELAGGRIGLVWATAEAYADSPERAIGKQSAYGGVPLLDVDSVRYNVAESIRRARREVLLSSPYLVPGASGMQVLREARARGVAVHLVTNSLAASDEPFVHTAYRRYRADLVRLGVEIDEISGSRVRRSVRLGLFGTATGRLHAKMAVIDRSLVFIGSLNFDPRSELHNTEIGLFIRSETLAGQVLKLAEVLRDQGAWRVRADADGRLQWHGTDDGVPQVLHTEPDASWWDRLLRELVAPFTPESLL